MTTLKLTILDLRNKGFSYKRIVKELGCSISTVSYHCSENTKENVNKRNRRYKTIGNKSKKLAISKLIGSLIRS